MGVQGIAERMGISVSTVESHRSHIRDKTGLRNAAELRAFAVRWARIEGWQVIPGEHGIPTVTREDGEHVYDDPRDGRRERAPAYAIEDRRNT
jgi:hypothetical protein